MRIHRTLTIFLVLSLALASVFVGSAKANASVLGDDYPANLKAAAQDALVDPWRFYNRECTSFVAWRLNSANGVGFTNSYLGAAWGNADHWGAAATAVGLTPDMTPAVGAVAWWSSGHVAWVAQVDSGSVTIEEYNYNYAGTYHTRSIPTNSVSGYIHIKDIPTWPPQNGAFVNDTSDGSVYRIAGGAPIWVSSWDPFGVQPVTNITHAQLSSLPLYPANGTFITGLPSGRTYRVAGGAPIYVSNWNNIGGSQATTAVSDYSIDHAGEGGAVAHLRSTPQDMFLRGFTTGAIYRVVGGHPYYVSSWDPYGGAQPYVDVDQWSIDNCEHLDCTPFGSMDAAAVGMGNVTAAGWAMDPNSQSPVTVKVLVDGKVTGSAIASGPRPDVDTVFHRGSAYGFSITVPIAVGAHDVCVQAINIGAGTGDAQLPCKTVTYSYDQFVKASYQDFLGRQPTTAELAAKTGSLSGGATTKQAYLSTMANSDEWLNAIVTKMYADTLGRQPDAAGLAAWTTLIRNKTFSVADVASRFYASDEYYLYHAGGTPTAWVTALYQKLLGRSPDAAGLAGWVGYTNNPAWGRAKVALAFYQSMESRLKRVDVLYQALLGRGPDSVGWPYWAQTVLSSGDITLAINLADSAEYWMRASTRY